jgi:hypothetical protein
VVGSLLSFVIEVAVKVLSKDCPVVHQMVVHLEEGFRTDLDFERVWLELTLKEPEALWALEQQALVVERWA